MNSWFENCYTALRMLAGPTDDLENVIKFLLSIWSDIAQVQLSLSLNQSGLRDLYSILESLAM